MFEYVQEREQKGRLEPRALVYLITTGATDLNDCEKLTERGMNQVLELARSRVVAGVYTIYTSSEKPALHTSQILEKEFDSKVTKRECLANVAIPGLKGSYSDVQDVLDKMWEDESFSPENGESLIEARKRFGHCLNEIVSKQMGNSFAVVADPLMVALFHSLVVAAAIRREMWMEMGHAACATYEFSRGWTVVMPPDNSFLSDPTCVADCFPEGVS